MTIKPYLSIIGILILCTTSIAQNFKFSEVSIDELETEEDSLFPQVDAIVLHRDVFAKVGHYIEVYEKIKILTIDGLDYATMEIPFFDVLKIRGNTFNLVNGNIQKTKLSKDMIFTEKIKGYGRTLENKKVSFPQVKVGSVIEIHYKASSGSAADIDMQYDIPIKKLTIEALNGTGSTYRFIQNPRAYLKVSRQDTDSKVYLSSINVPPLEHENYVYDMELYRAKLIMRRLGYNEAPMFDKWEDVPKLLYDVDDFAFQVRPKGVYREEISTLIKGVEIPLEKIELIYNYLKENIEWNGYFGIYPDQGTRWTFNKKKGDVSDINMLFVSILRSIGLVAYPVLASSKMNGIHLTVSREAFNYTLTGTKISGKWYVFDAANPKATFDYIPEYMINWRGMLVKDDGNFEWINLTSPKVSKSSLIANAKLDNDLVLSGSIKERKTGYFGIELRHQIKDSKVENDSLLEVNFKGLQYKNIDIDVDDITAVVDASYNFILEDAVEKLGDELYLSPLFFLSISENPFKKSVRQFAIDFGYTFLRQYNFSVKLPVGYEPTFIPDPIKVSMPNNFGSYYYRVSVNGGNLQVLTKFEVNVPIIPLKYYEELKEFFKIRVEKENEKVILRRTN
jgi:transglutaminase-like putative cysteine protease